MTDNIVTIHKYKTEFNADSVEWCPHEPTQNLFVCANYQLKEDGSRTGCILLFSATLDHLRLLQTIYTAAVLDQKWCHNQINNRSILAVANAQNSIEIYVLTPQLQLELITSCEIDEGNEILMLSLDWSTGKNFSNEPQIVCSDSKGNIHTFRLVEDKLIREESWKGHDFEAWIAAFYYWEPNIIFTGGDDSRFLKFDKRVGLEPIVRNKSHEAGVTSIHSNSQKEYLLATGSYDSNVRLWDIRSLKACTASIQMPGPLWRLKWDPYEHKHLLAACMLGGIHVVTPQDRLQITHSYSEHTNIAYGADWSYLHKNNSTLIASCSFYDNLLCISKIKLK